MGKILGLDLGTNSIGWAVIDLEKITSLDLKQKEKGIIDCGSRIFKEGVNKNSSGKEVSKNAARRNARSIRRKNYRFKMRRERLKKELAKLGMMPDEKFYTYSKECKGNHTIELFKLRRDALEKQIRLQDIGRIFLQINNHRGFKSNKKEDAVINVNIEKQKEQQGVKGVIQKLENRINEYGCRTIGEYYYFLIDKNNNAHNPNEPKLINEDDFIRGEGAYTSRELFAKEFDLIWNKQKEYYPEILTEENKEIIKDECIFYHRDLRSAKHLRNRCKLENKGYRKDKNGKKQINYLPCCPKSSFEFQEYRIWEQLNKLRFTNEEGTHQSLSIEQKNELANKLHVVEKLSLKDIKKALNYSRDTKFNDIGDHLKGNVTQARLIDALGLDFWNNQNPLEYDNKENEKYPFEPIDYSNTQKQLWHNIEYARDKDWLLGEDMFLKDVHRKNRRQAQKENYEYKPHNQWQLSIKKIGLTHEQIIKYANTTFEPGFSDLSTKAIRKLLFFMKQGQDPVTASYHVYGDYASTVQKEDIKLEYKIPQIQNNRLKNPVVEKSVKETIKVINAVIDKYGKPDEIHLEMARELKMPKDARENINKRNTDKDKIREEYAKFLSKKLSRNIDKTSPDIKKFEMFLELNYSQEGFDSKIKGQITSKEIKDFFALKIPSDKTKYYLWLECDRRDPYEGKTINLSTLFSSEIEIEHIIPFSLCGDDSFMNKTLSFKAFNAKKGNKTPMQYFEDKSKEKKEFEKNIKDFSDAKKERFLMTDDKLEKFRNSQLNNTAYIATEVRKHLLKSYEKEKVELTNGTMTSLVRKLLGFNGILNKPIRVEEMYRGMGKVWAILDENKNITDYITRVDDKEHNNVNSVKGVINNYMFYPSKTRNDHRHHAVDALITALLNKKINYEILKSTEGAVNKETGEYFPKFYTNEKGQYRLTKDAISDIKYKLNTELNLVNSDDLLPSATSKIENILVSYQNEKLTSLPRKKIYKANGSPLQKDGKHLRSGGLNVRNELHEANFYGKTKDCKENEFVRRIDINELSFKQLTKIVDKKIQGIIIEKIGDYILRILADEDKPIILDDEALKSKERIYNIIFHAIEENRIKEQLLEIKGEKGKEFVVKRKQLKNEEERIKKALPSKNDVSKIKKAIEKGLKEAIKEGFFLENEGKRQKKKKKYDPSIERNPIPIKKVRVKYISNTAQPVKRKNIKAQLTPNKSREINREKYQYIMPGNNYQFVIYGDLEPDEDGIIQRDKHIVSWFDKAQIDIENNRIRKENKNTKNKVSLLPYYPEKDLPVLCELSHNDMVVVFENTFDEINWDNQEELFNRLFTVVKFTENQFVLARHNLSNVKSDTASSVKDILSGEDTVIRPTAGTFRGVKVKINILGQIEKI